MILSCLRADGRCKLAQVSRTTNVPISTLFERLRAYKGTVLAKTTSLLNFNEIGFATRAHLLIRCQRQREEVKQKLLEYANVNSLYRVNNGYDYLAECVFRTLQDAEIFSEQLRTTFDAIVRVQYILADLKRETFLSDPNLVHHVYPTRHSSGQPF